MLHTSPEMVLLVIETLLQCKETLFRLETDSSQPKEGFMQIRSQKNNLVRFGGQFLVSVAVVFTYWIPAVTGIETQILSAWTRT